MRAGDAAVRDYTSLLDLEGVTTRCGTFFVALRASCIALVAVLARGGAQAPEGVREVLAGGPPEAVRQRLARVEPVARAPDRR
jgi:hypothetical protein